MNGVNFLFADVPCGDYVFLCEEKWVWVAKVSKDDGVPYP